jgi:hypothetical protein
VTQNESCPHLQASIGRDSQKAQELKDGPIWRDALCLVQLLGTDGDDPRFEKIVASLAPKAADK